LLIHCAIGLTVVGLGRQPGFFDVDVCLAELSAKGDDLERISELVYFEMFRPDLERAVPRSDGSRGGSPAFDHVLMFKVLLLLLQAILGENRLHMRSLLIKPSNV
jgi:transposase, IS5 family